MYKYLLGVILITIFTACSTPKPEVKPSWFITLPKDLNFFYATGSHKNLEKAKKIAIASLRKQISAELNSAFKNNVTDLLIESNQNIEAIILANEYFANTLSMRTIRVENSSTYKNDKLILIKFSRKDMFDIVSKNLENILVPSKESFTKVQDEIAVKRFMVISELMQDYPKISSLIQAKKVALPNYKTKDEFNYINKLRTSYVKLKKDITFYVLSDVNSRTFVPAIKNALRATGLLLSTKLENKDSLKLLITSKTTNDEVYSFNQAKSLVKFSTYDIDKKKVSFKQHTFIGKSRKNHKEAKEQSSLNLKSKVTKMGIYNFLGFN